MIQKIKPLKVFHVDDDSNVRNSIQLLVSDVLKGEYVGSQDFEEFEKQVAQGLENFGKYNVIFITDGQFPAKKYKYSQAYLEVIDFLSSKINSTHLKLLVISGKESIVEDATAKGFKDSLVKPFNPEQLEKILQSYLD